MIQQTGFSVSWKKPMIICLSHSLGIHSHVITNNFNHSIVSVSRIPLWHLLSPTHSFKYPSYIRDTMTMNKLIQPSPSPPWLMSFLSLPNLLVYHGQSRSLSWIDPRLPCLSLCLYSIAKTTSLAKVYLLGTCTHVAECIIARENKAASLTLWSES